MCRVNYVLLLRKSRSSMEGKPQHKRFYIVCIIALQYTQMPNKIRHRMT